MNKVVQLKDIVDLRRETIQPDDRNKKINFVGLKHIDSGVSTLKRWGDASEVKSVKSRFYPDDVLYGKLRPYLDKAVIAEFSGICSSDILVFTATSKVIPRFLVYLLHSHTFKSYAVSTSSGITLPRTSWNTLGKFTLTLPPLAEQRRIAAKLEVLFTQLDAAVDQLKKAQVQLERYRRSILKAAFEGELTRDWRDGYLGELEPMAASEVSTLEGLPKLPDGWVWSQVKDIAKFIRGVSYKKNQSSKIPIDDYVPILRANNINTQLNFEDLVYVPRERVKDEQFIKTLDIIIAMSSGSKHLVGKAAQAHQDFNGGFGTFCGLVRVSEEINQKFVGLFFQSPAYRNEISRLSIGININNLRRENIEAMLVALPPLPEQAQIVSELERYLSVADAIAATLEAELGRAERLRQSILKHAFSGALVPQDPNDEPASVLLEKIQDKKEPQQSKRKKAETVTSAKQLALPLD